MDFADIRAAINARLESAWTQTPIAFENSAFAPQPEQPFLRVYLMERASQRPLAWNRPETSSARLSGGIYLIAYIPEGYGSQMVDDILSPAKSLFEGQTIQSQKALIHIHQASGTIAGPEAPWFKKLISLPFWAEPLPPT